MTFLNREKSKFEDIVRNRLTPGQQARLAEYNRSRNNFRGCTIGEYSEYDEYANYTASDFDPDEGDRD